jgi:hypothetical protein
MAEPGHLLLLQLVKLEYYELDDFTDPWKEAETIVIQHGLGRNARFWYHWVPLSADNRNSSWCCRA